MKLICGIPTKNEEWIIEKTLNVLVKFCDKIVILDDNSEDKTEEICKNFDKVEFIKRYSQNILDTGMSALGKTELFNHVIKHNPDYILMLDADEIPTPAFLTFLENLDPTIKAFRPRFINVHKDGNFYRTDNFKTKFGACINWNPFSNPCWRKVVLMKYDKNYKYFYNTKKLYQSSGKNHPCPENIKDPVKDVEDFYIIHYGKIDPRYLSGEKDKRYAEIETKIGRGNYQSRLKHHEQCRLGGSPIYKECKKEWFWE